MNNTDVLHSVDRRVSVHIDGHNRRGIVFNYEGGTEATIVFPNEDIDSYMVYTIDFNVVAVELQSMRQKSNRNGEVGDVFATVWEDGEVHKGMIIHKSRSITRVIYLNDKAEVGLLPYNWMLLYYAPTVEQPSPFPCNLLLHRKYGWYDTIPSSFNAKLEQTATRTFSRTPSVSTSPTFDTPTNGASRQGKSAGPTNSDVKGDQLDPHRRGPKYKKRKQDRDRRKKRKRARLEDLDAQTGSNL